MLPPIPNLDNESLVGRVFSLLSTLGCGKVMKNLSMYYGNFLLPYFLSTSNNFLKLLYTPAKKIQTKTRKSKINSTPFSILLTRRRFFGIVTLLWCTLCMYRFSGQLQKNLNFELFGKVYRNSDFGMEFCCITAQQPRGQRCFHSSLRRPRVDILTDNCYRYRSDDEHSKSKFHQRTSS